MDEHACVCGASVRTWAHVLEQESASVHRCVAQQNVAPTAPL